MLDVEDMTKMTSISIKRGNGTSDNAHFPHLVQKSRSLLKSLLTGVRSSVRCTSVNSRKQVCLHTLLAL